MYPPPADFSARCCDFVQRFHGQSARAEDSGPCEKQNLSGFGLRAGGLFGPPDSLSVRIDHDKAAPQRLHFRLPKEFLDEFVDRERSRALRPEQDYTRVFAWRVLR
jgi:hypothetical protein